MKIKIRATLLQNVNILSGLFHPGYEIILFNLLKISKISDKNEYIFKNNI